MSFTKAFTKNAVFKGLSEVMIRLLSFAFIILVARVLGDNAFGTINFSFSFALLFVVIVDFGLNPLMVRDGAKNLQQTKNLFFNLLFIKFALATIFVVVVMAARQWASQDVQTMDIVMWMMLFVMLNSFTEFINALFHAHQKMQYEALVMTLQKLGLLFFGVMALHMGMGVRGVAVAYAAAGGLGVVAAVVILLKKRLLFGTWKWDPNFFKYIWKQALPLTLTTLFINLYFRIDMTLLNKLRSAEEVGWYAAAHKCIEVLMVIPAIVVVAAFPGMSKLFHENREALVRAATKIIRLLLLLGMPIAGGAVLVAQPLMIALFGQEYAPAGHAMIWLSVALCFIFINYLLSYLLISGGHQSINAVVSGLAVLVSIGMNLWLIPLWGYRGAAIAAAVTELFLLIAYAISVRKVLFIIPASKPFLRILFATGLMMGVVWLLRENHVAVLITVGMLVYAAGVWLIGAVEKEDVQMLRKIMKGRSA